MKCFYGHLENIVSLAYADYSNVNTLHYTVSKIIFANITANLIRKMSKYLEVVIPTVVDKSFPKFEILLEIQKFTLNNKYYQFYW